MIMKKVFTLIAGVLIASSAFGQAKWTSVITNGDFEGEDLSNFWVQEYREPGTGEQVAGAPAVAEDVKNAGNHCAVVRVRSKAEAGQEDDLQRYDTQFFVTTDQEITAGKMMRLSMKIRAEGSTHLGTQVHAGPGQYINYNSFGEKDVTEEWQTITFDEIQVPVDGSWVNGDSGEGVRTVAFDLTTNQDGAVFYFDDVTFEVKDGELPHDLTGWFSLIRNGDLATDNTSNFIARNGNTNFGGENNGQGPAERIIDIDGKPAVVVHSVSNATYETMGVVDANGNPVAITDWQSQFFVTGNHEFKTGQKMKFVIWARADHPTNIQTQIHRKTPGDYLHYQMFGDLNLTEEWQRFEFSGDDGQGLTISASQNGGYTIAFNCNVYKDEDNTYYFRDIEYYCNEADVLDKDRIVASEPLILPVGEPNGDTPMVAVDMTEAMKALEANNLSEIVNGNMKILANEEGGYSPAMAATSGGGIGDDGYYKDAEDGVIFVYLDESLSSGNTAYFVVDNAADVFPDDKTVDTQICLIKDGWYYAFDVRLVSQAVYTGISEVRAKQENNVIYDLMGRKVARPAKGIYIMNGKKYIMK